MNFLKRMFSSRPDDLCKIKPTGDTFVDSCFTFEFENAHDERFYNAGDRLDGLPMELQMELLRMARLRDEGKASEGISFLNAVSGKYVDFDVMYDWKALFLLDLGNLSDARTILLDGINKAKRKSRLCSLLAHAEYIHGSFDQAVIWWTRSAVAQTTSRCMNDHNAFLYLGEVAFALRDHSSGTILLQEADKIQRPNVRLSQKEESRLHGKVGALKRPIRSQTLKAIRILCKRFLPTRVD